MSRMNGEPMSAVPAERVGHMTTAYDEHRREEQAATSLTRLRIEQRCARCPWPDVCAKDVTCWELERRADRSDVTGEPIFPESGPGPQTEPGERSGTVDKPAGKKWGLGVIWTRESIIEAIKAFADEHGRPPRQGDARATNGLPSAATMHKHLGSFANAIEAAGFPRPVRGQQPNGDPGNRYPRVEWLEERGAANPRGWIRVPGTGLAYRSVEEALVAAEEIEADGERVARAARVEGNEVKSERAIDQSRALANAVRYAASLAAPDIDSPFTEGAAPEARLSPSEPAASSELAGSEIVTSASTVADLHHRVCELEEQLMVARQELGFAIVQLDALIDQARLA